MREGESLPNLHLPLLLPVDPVGSSCRRCRSGHHHYPSSTRATLAAREPTTAFRSERRGGEVVEVEERFLLKKKVEERWCSGEDEERGARIRLRYFKRVGGGRQTSGLVAYGSLNRPTCKN